MAITRGIPEVPILSDEQMHPQLRRFLQDLREELIRMRGSQAPLAVPTNVKVTAQGFQNLVQFTRSTGADYYEVLHNTVPNLATAQVVDVGDSAMWVDSVGNTGVLKYYWVRARRLNGSRSIETSPVSATTLASGTGVTPPAPPPPAQVQVTDQTTGRVIYSRKPGLREDF